MDKSNIENLPDDLKAIYKSRWATFISDQKRRSFSLNILFNNGEELLNSAKRIHDPDLMAPTIGEENREASNQAHREFNRHLHNFVASAMTLVDHTRVMLKERYEGESILNEINEHITNTVAKIPVCKFVQDMRNYIVHRGLPNSQIYNKFTKNENDSFNYTVGIQIPTADLLDYQKWTAPAKSYLEQAGEYIDILNLVSSYIQEVQELNKWLISILEKYHEKDFFELIKLQEKFNDKSLDEKSKNQSPNKKIEQTPTTTSNKEKVDSIANLINTQIKKYDIKNNNHNEFKSKRHAVEIFDENAFKNLITHTTSENGDQLILFINEANGHYGLTAQQMEKLGEIFTTLGTEDWARQKFDVDFLQSTFISWARMSWSTEEKSSYYDFVRSEVEKDTEALRIYYPISNLEIETVFNFGPLVVSPISEDIFKPLDESAEERSAGNSDAPNHQIQHERKKIVGLAAIEFNINAHPSIATKFTYKLARDAVDILRFFSPMAPYFDQRCAMALKGLENLQTQYIVIHSGNAISIKEGLIHHPPATWELSESRSKILLERGLSLAGGLIESRGLSSFSKSVRAALILFSKGSTLVETADRLQYTLAAAESIFLNHEFELAESKVPRRISIIYHPNTKEMELVKDSISKCYFLRNDQKEYYSQRELSAIHICTIAVHRAIETALMNKENFSTKENFIYALHQ